MSKLVAALLLSTLGAPPELGDVDWGRDFERAAARGERTGRPLLVLFDEVPGCQTCVRYGQAVLRHPLLVEAAETLFVPVAIYNNAGGKDRATLQRFGEPSWNNPVVRIVSPEGEDLAPRLAGDYRVSALAERMVRALEKLGTGAPDWLAVLGAAPEPDRRAYVAMPCFWSGEACLGGVEGVRSTRTGWMKGQEVVEIEVAPGAETAVMAAAKRCGEAVYSSHPALRTALARLEAALDAR